MARDIAGLALTTLRQLVQPVIEACDFYDMDAVAAHTGAGRVPIHRSGQSAATARSGRR